jgi:hypothetical protein
MLPQRKRFDVATHGPERTSHWIWRAHRVGPRQSESYSQDPSDRANQDVLTLSYTCDSDADRLIYLGSGEYVP